MFFRRNNDPDITAKYLAKQSRLHSDFTAAMARVDFYVKRMEEEGFEQHAQSVRADALTLTRSFNTVYLYDSAVSSKKQADSPAHLAYLRKLAEGADEASELASDAAKLANHDRKLKRASQRTLS